jgi:hypothetical protein
LSIPPPLAQREIILADRPNHLTLPGSRRSAPDPAPTSTRSAAGCDNRLRADEKYLLCRFIIISGVLPCFTFNWLSATTTLASDCE